MIFDVLKSYIQTQHYTVPLLYLHGRYMPLTNISVHLLPSTPLHYSHHYPSLPSSLLSSLLSSSPSITQAFTSAQYMPHQHLSMPLLPPSYSVTIHTLNSIHQMFILLTFLSFYSFYSFYLYRRQPPDQVIIFSHGNAEDLGLIERYLQELTQVCDVSILFSPPFSSYLS